MNNNTIKNLFTAYEKENAEKIKNKLYTIKNGEKYNSLSVKSAGLEKIKKVLATYEPRNEKEKAMLDYYTSNKYYGKNTAQQQHFIIELLNA